jgi:hypothetical protein
LRKIFGIVRRMPAPADESVERRPVGLAKLSQRSLGRFRFGLALTRRQNHAPMSGLEWIARPMNGVGLGVHVSGVSVSCEENKSRK